MAWDGWYQFDGSEIINVARTEQYARNLGAYWLKPQFKNADLPVMLGDGEKYLTPLLDDAPWLDGDAPESQDFFGLYPLSIDGVESSTRAATTVEAIGNGGAVVGVRHSTKAMVFSGALCATSEEGVEYGFRWLKQVLNGPPCGGGGGNDCSGGDLCYLSSEPRMGVGFAALAEDTVADPTGYGEGVYGGGVYGGGIPYGRLLTGPECLVEYQRTTRNVTVTQGPVVTAKRTLQDGSAVWTVSFTAVAGNPYEYGPDVPIFEGFGHPTAYPYADGITGGIWTPGPYVVDEADCPKQTYRAVYDPLCPAMIPPPAPASVAMGCFSQPQNWERRHITIPKQYVPLWGDVVPTIGVHAGDEEVRSLRLRFYADPYDEANPNSDPCGYCGDILISFIPRNTTLVFDGVEQTVYVQYPGTERRRADSLVFKTDGTPFEWPVLSCGMGYVVTFDLPQTQTPPLFDLTLTSRVL